MIEIWPVIHAKDAQQVIECAKIANIAQCPGVFLISMHGDDSSLDSYAMGIRGTFPYLQIGVNYLTLSAVEAVVRSQRLGYAATWTDRQEFTGEVSKAARDLRSIMKPNHRVFAAVAFKGQPDDPSPMDSAGRAASFGCIPTTSGTATGLAPSDKKIQGIRAGLLRHTPLAIASGVTPENVVRFVPYVSHVLVSTGISKDFYEFDLRKLMLLREKCK